MSVVVHTKKDFSCKNNSLIGTLSFPNNSSCMQYISLLYGHLTNIWTHSYPIGLGVFNCNPERCIIKYDNPRVNN